MVAKYFVWGDGLWREIDLASGRVTGWRRRARFVFVRHGRLLLARHRPVLRALQALAVGAPSAAADGRRLSHRSKTERSKTTHKSPAVAVAPPVAPEPPAALPACVHQHHSHCCTHNRCVDNSKQNPAPPSLSTPTPAGAAPLRRNMSTQCPPPRAGPAAHALTFNLPHATSAAAPVAHTAPTAPSAPITSAPTDSVVTVADVSSAGEIASGVVRTNTNGLDPLLEKHAPANKKSTRKKNNTSDRAQRAKRRVRAVSSEQTESSTGSERACKELLVSEGDVAAVRSYVRARFPDALKRFDSDEAYKCQLFYSINPLVEVERCARLERLLSQHSAAALSHFAARLGLTPRTSSSASTPSRPLVGPASQRRERSTSTDTDKENKDKYSSPNKVRSEPIDEVKKSPQLRPKPAAGEPVPTRARRQGVSERSNKHKEDVMIKAPEANGDSSDPPNAKRQATAAAAPPPTVNTVVRVPPGTHVISKRASQANAKEYSNLEDHAIVAWVSGGDRASVVNGNRIWRELQEQYERLTGRERSWHSLRNRYLRYILPSLGALHLPPADVSRLRAAAATGVMKTMHRAAGAAGARHSMFASPARGASSRRPRAPAPDKRDDDTDDPSPPKRRSLRSQPQQATHTDTHESSDDFTSKGSATKAAANSKESPSKASRSNKPGSSKKRSPRYSEVTRRFAARHPSPSSRTSSSSPSPSPAQEPSSRSRRLFNPNAVV